MSPPNEPGATGDRARSERVLNAAKLIEAFREFKGIAPVPWIDEGWRLVNEFQRTKNIKHLQAFSRHVVAIKDRIQPGPLP